MKRRNFIKTAGCSAAASLIIPGAAGTGEPAQKARAAGQASVKAADGTVRVETSTLSAVLEKGSLVSLKSKISGEEFIEKPDRQYHRAVQLLYANNDLLNINEEKFGSTEVRQITDMRVDFIFNSWDGDAVLTISADPETGDLLIEPSAYSSRPGVLACRWNIAGIKRSVDLVAPFFQGVKMKLDDPLIKNERWIWPSKWEAGLAILQSKEGGFWVHTQDDRYRFKALHTGSESDPFTLGFDSEANGPVDNNLSSGGLCWRINTYQGDWHVPAEIYRQWHRAAYRLDEEEKRRQPWIYDTRFAVSWCPGEPDILDAIAKRVKPERVLIHFPEWRTDNYDENYPDYFANEKAKAFIKKGNQMGFHIMPHFNSIDMDPSNPVYTKIRDFQYRSVETKQLQGWSWYNNTPIGVPESNANRITNRDKKVMVKIHPGLSMWRSVLCNNILNAVRENSLHVVFTDVTLCIWNLHNCIVESMTPTEGMKKLIRQVSELNNGLPVGGEGLNEITAQVQSFAQVHLFKSWQGSAEGLERAGGCDLNEFLFGSLCRSFGYSNLSGETADEELRMRIHTEHKAIPTVTINSAADILKPNQAVNRMLELAK